MSDAAFQSLFDAMVVERGGLAALDPLHIEIITVCCRLLVSIRSADPTDVPKIAASLSQLQAQLPTTSASATDGPPIDLAQLSDGELCELERLIRIGRGEAEPHVEPIAPPARVPGAGEIEGALLGRYIDEHIEAWRSGRLSERDRREICNGITAVLRGVATPSGLWQGELASKAAATIAPMSAIGGKADIARASQNVRL
jgi:hypothetical protein